MKNKISALVRTVSILSTNHVEKVRKNGLREKGPSPCCSPKPPAGAAIPTCRQKPLEIRGGGGWGAPAVGARSPRLTRRQLPEGPGVGAAGFVCALLRFGWRPVRVDIPFESSPGTGEGSRLAVTAQSSAATI